MTETDDPFRCLGYLSGTYYYYSRGEQAVVALGAGAHTKKNLYRLAPHEYWATKYRARKDDFDENAVASALLENCQKNGIFSIKLVRGRGVWMDKNGLAIHYGDRVSIAKKDYKPFSAPGKFIYELAEPLGYQPCEPLSDTEAGAFPDLMQQLRWQTPDQFKWFSGWLVCALIGGALHWRPHIWLTGAAQSGKTTLSGIINIILKSNCLYIKSVSTEAGIRQSLKADCLAVVMDEAEREDAQSHSRLQAVITLARQASSDDDSRIVKGTPAGNALSYQIRSPFCLSSINSALIQTADKGRFTNIELSAQKLSGDAYYAWKDKINTLLTEDYIQRLYSRVFSLAPIISKNAQLLARAIERKTGDRRLGDQYGALLAGDYSFSSAEELSEDDAKWLIDTIQFAHEKERATGINDQHRLLNSIMQHVMRVPKDRGYEELSIGDMCWRVHKGWDTGKECKSILANIGIKIIAHGENKTPSIAIANDNENLREMLKHTHWPDNWSQTLQRISFAYASESAVYFSTACTARAVIFPIASVLSEDK